MVCLMGKLNKKCFVFLCLALLCAGSLAAEEAKEDKGYTGLYMGHSFFWPSVHQLKKVVPDTPLLGHKQFLVQGGGAKGSPGKLWENQKTRKAGQAHLNTKSIDLLVLTYHSPGNSSIEHYSKWFDYALAQNPDTTCMVTLAWGTHLYKADETRLNNLKNGPSRLYDALIVKLRKKYPENTVLYCPYGLGTYELIDRFNQGKLPGIKFLLNMDRETRPLSRKNNEQIFNDELGHAGELVSTLGALLWLKTLHDIDLSTVSPQRARGLPDIDLNEIAETVSKKIKPFNTKGTENGGRKQAAPREE